MNRGIRTLDKWGIKDYTFKMTVLPLGQSYIKQAELRKPRELSQLESYIYLHCSKTITKLP